LPKIHFQNLFRKIGRKQWVAILLTVMAAATAVSLPAFQVHREAVKPEGMEKIPSHVDRVAASVGDYLYFPHTLGEEEDSADFIVRGTLLDDAEQKLQKDGKSLCGDCLGYTLSTFQVSRVYKGNLIPGDRILLGESCYTTEEDGKVTLHEIEYAPSAPNRKYIFFLKKEKDSAEFPHGFYTPVYKELGRYPVAIAGKESPLSSDMLENCGIHLVQAGSEYTGIGQEVVWKYME